MEKIILKGTSFYSKELEKAGVKDVLRFFNDIITEKRSPHPESGYREPVLVDIMIDGKKCDIYHSDHSDSDTTHRLFIHIKE